jgi:acetyl-CoA carboxylase carboxyltransferase component
MQLFESSFTFHKEIEAAKDKEKMRVGLAKEYKEHFANPYIAAGLGYIDQVIFPREMGPLICSGLEMLESKRKTRPPKKHGNIPL